MERSVSELRPNRTRASSPVWNNGMIPAGMKFGINKSTTDALRVDELVMIGRDREVQWCGRSL